jgi:hypothetical protein
MPILTDIRDHDLLGPYFKMGPLVGERMVVRWLIGMRFSPIPDWADERLRRLSAAGLQAVTDHLIEAKSLEELLQ